MNLYRVEFSGRFAGKAGLSEREDVWEELLEAETAADALVFARVSNEGEKRRLKAVRITKISAVPRTPPAPSYEELASLRRRPIRDS